MIKLMSKEDAAKAWKIARELLSTVNSAGEQSVVAFHQRPCFHLVECGIETEQRTAHRTVKNILGANGEVIESSTFQVYELKDHTPLLSMFE